MFASPFGLRLPDRTLNLSVGTVIVGRSRRCDIVISERKVSRRHARLVVHAHEVILEDISRVNRVWVNDSPLVGPQRIDIGDRLAFGPVRAELCVASRERSLSLEPTERAFIPDLHAFTPAGHAAQPRAGRVPAAEASEPAGAPELLERFLLRCEAGAEVRSDELEMIVAVATRFAESTRDGAWVNYVFRVFTALARPLPATIVDRLYGLLRKASGTSLTAFRNYTTVLQARRDQLGPREQFLVRRIQGLEPLIVLQAHTIGT